jgi:hypothetical protein
MKQQTCKVFIGIHLVRPALLWSTAFKIQEILAPNINKNCIMGTLRQQSMLALDT